MGIKLFIEKITGQLFTGPKFYYAGDYEHNANDQLDYSTGVVNLKEIEEPGFHIHPLTGVIRRRCPVQIQFLKKDERLDTKAVNRDMIISEMWHLAAEFLQRLNESEEFETFPEIINGLSVINRYDNNVTGVEISVVLIMKDSANICL